MIEKGLKQANIYIDNNYYNRNYNINVVESTPFLIMFMRIMLENNGILLHSAAIKENFDAGHIFCGVSDAGKTTISNLFLKNDITVLTDETAILRICDGKVMLYGSPWKGSGDNIFKNDKALLKQINFIYHCKENILRVIDTQKALEIMVKQAFPFFWEQNLVLKNFSIIVKILKQVPHYSFGFLPNKTSVEYYINYEKE